MNSSEIYTFLESQKQLLGFAEIGLVSLNQSLIKSISSEFNSFDHSKYPAYLVNTLDQRKNPLIPYPWAKSIFICAYPFSLLPDLEWKLPEPKNAKFAGKVAGYATKMDYHFGGKDIFAKFADNLNSFFAKSANGNFKTEICIDTAPVAERTLALLSGIATLGQNKSMLVADFASGCFIGEIFTDLELSDELFLCNQKLEKINQNCYSCGSCIKSCPTEALNALEFNCSRCISHLTMEKRGVLSLEERKLIGNWIFGCDNCTATCPGSNLPESKNVDLEWLLFASSADIKKSIRSTALNYAGTTLLRRNALAVLENYATESTLQLISRFSKVTGSEMLKETANSILKRF